MASLALSFSELYNAVSKFLGTHGDSGPTGTALTDAKDTVYSGYRRFLTSYDWTFLKPYDKIITVSGTWEYELPTDFSSMAGTFQYSANSVYPPLEERSVDEIVDFKAVNDYSSYPEFFAIRTGRYHKETGMNYEVIFFPKPNAAYTFSYRYNRMVDKLVNDADIPIGGAEMSELIKQMCLAEAESSQDEKLDTQEKKVAFLFEAAIKRDNKRRPKTLGYNAGGQRLSAWEIARGSYRVNDVVYDTSS